jgi:hypothetical protein
MDLTVDVDESAHLPPIGRGKGARLAKRREHSRAPERSRSNAAANLRIARLEQEDHSRRVGRTLGKAGARSRLRLDYAARLRRNYATEWRFVLLVPHRTARRGHRGRGHRCRRAVAVGKYVPSENSIRSSPSASRRSRPNVVRDNSVRSSVHAKVMRRGRATERERRESEHRLLCARTALPIEADLKDPTDRRPWFASDASRL